MSIREI